MKKVTYTVTTGAKPIGEHTMIEPMPDRSWEQFDPFLLLHHHGPHTFEPYNQGLPFGPHPHRGFETLTLIYKGSIEHKDSSGASSIIDEGGIQWMTAGKGIVHSENVSEATRENGGEMEIIQLWMNLPSKHKMTPARYQGLAKAEIPTIESNDKKVTTQVIAGTQSKEEGKIDSLTHLTILNIEAQKESKGHYQLVSGETTMLYLLNGVVVIEGKKLVGPVMAQLSSDETELALNFEADSRALLFSGKPLKEPIVAQGPFVMNSTTEILKAMRDYQMGKMGVL